MSDNPDFGSLSDLGVFTPPECGYRLPSPRRRLSHDGDPAGWQPAGTSKEGPLIFATELPANALQNTH